MADTTNKPYLKAFGGDVMTGGWFYNGGNCSSGPGTNYQNPNFSSARFSSDNRDGGILTYTKTSGTASGGASDQYRVTSLGEIDGRRAGDGFYSDGAQPGSNVKALSFANFDITSPLAFGGVFEGSVAQSMCIPDYYSRKPSSAQDFNNFAQAIANGSGDYKKSVAAGSNYQLTNGSADRIIPAGQKMSIYIDGNVYIDANIKYDPASTVDSVPKFALIVRGSIYIDKSVTQLDGMYVAEPADNTPAAVSSDTGIIWTCHDNSTGAKLDFTYPTNCTSPLVVNGSLIAKQLMLLRVKGDINSASTAEDSLSTISSCVSGACNVAEVVNYSPSIIMGGSFFNTRPDSSTNGLPVDKIVSLPPVF